MSEQRPVAPPAPPSRVVRDVVAVLCLLAAVAIVNVVAWSVGIREGLLALAGNLAIAGVLLGLSR